MNIFPDNLKAYLDVSKPLPPMEEVAYFVEAPSGTRLRLELQTSIIAKADMPHRLPTLYRIELSSAFGQIRIVHDEEERIWELLLEGQDGSQAASLYPMAECQDIAPSEYFTRLIQALSTFSQDELSVSCHLCCSSAFRLRVCLALLSIPRGRLRSYQAIAEQIGQPRALQAVGSAVGSNPLSILIPCHRVIRSSGHIGGYAHGVGRKEQILGYELSGLQSSLL